MYEELRNLDLRAVVELLGIDTKWKQGRGGNWTTKCPVHKPRKNITSFSVDDQGRFNCFACPAKGRGSIDLVMQIRGIGFQEAVELLENLKVPQALPQVPLEEKTYPTANQPFKGSYDKFFKPHPWLDQRGLIQETLAHFGSGYYENNTRRSQYNGSVLLKIQRYSDGECVGYLSRNIGDITPDKPKYRFPPNFHKSLELFGAFQLKEKRPVRVLYLVESPFCVMRFFQYGIPAVSPFGWSVSKEQVDILSSLARGIVFLPDRNKRQDALQSIGIATQNIWVKTPSLPDGIEDPEYLSVQQIRSLA